VTGGRLFTTNQTDINVCGESSHESNKAIQIEAYGNPTEVVKVVDLPDVGAPVAWQASERKEPVP
jgi:hypothetical protein